MKQTDDYERVLKWICEESAKIPVCCSYDGGVYPCTWIAKDLKISVRKVRRIMKRLEAGGYVVKDHYGGWDEWNGKIFCIHGYAAAKKVGQMAWYKEKRAQEEEDIRRWADGEHQG
jgi:hypothetical protein